jgi:hypothetical protein
MGDIRTAAIETSSFEVRMYAISHAATALVLKHRYPAVAWWTLLVAVQAAELLWVVFTYAGVEHVAYTADAVHLDFLPSRYSSASCCSTS